MKYALLLILPLLVACGEKVPPAEKIDTGPKLVKAIKVGPGGTASEEAYSGEVRARIESTLGFRVGGKLVERLVDVGARVKAGQVLARLDPADQQLTAMQAEANRTLAAAELQRTQELRQKNFISQAALDVKETAATAAAAQATLAKNQAAYTTLVADAAGVVSAVLAEPGQVVGAGQAVFRLARDGEREVAFAIPESRLAGLKVGADSTATLWSGKTYRGVLRELAPVADAATRTFAARVKIVDADDAVALGMTATVRFVRKSSAELIVPLAAILQQGDKPAVWVIGEDGAVRQQPIDIARYGDAGAVVAAGLNGGETIVAAGAFKLSAGEKVRIAQP
ncbi:MAG: efflux RND transporter periplasmic adaptor subunit [Rhodocyclaceae bacterium]|nr:efflux RND transporter periplasmic adaptor subunit [Rhodocyclaceae bacterium]MDZ4215958.1 efflux RND transporter periplasmic adaptor subunit [Rhodocyclaceae bacterium]